MLDIFAKTGTLKFDPGIVIQELTPIISSLYHQLDNMSAKLHKCQSELNVYSLERERKRANGERLTGLEIPYVPVPFQNGTFPDLPIRNLEEISLLSREELRYLLHGYGMGLDTPYESVACQKQRLGTALGLNLQCITWLAKN